MVRRAARRADAAGPAAGREPPSANPPTLTSATVGGVPGPKSRWADAETLRFTLVELESPALVKALQFIEVIYS